MPPSAFPRYLRGETAGKPPMTKCDPRYQAGTGLMPRNLRRWAAFFLLLLFFYFLTINYDFHHEILLCFATRFQPLRSPVGGCIPSIGRASRAKGPLTVPACVSTDVVNSGRSRS